MAKRNRPRTKAEEQADKRRTGRPAMAPSDKKTARVTIQLTPDERERLGEIARAEDIPLAALIMRPWREEGN